MLIQMAVIDEHCPTDMKNFRLGIGTGRAKQRAAITTCEKWRQGAVPAQLEKLTGCGNQSRDQSDADYSSQASLAH